MRGPCETCLDHNRVRPGPYFRSVETLWGKIGMYLCAAHALALTMLDAYRERESKPVSRHTMIHVDDNGRASAHEVM